MATLTETRIEIADRHTTLCHFTGCGKVVPALTLGTSKNYIDLYVKAEASGLDYSSVAGNPGKILEKILPVYKNTKYWRRYLSSDPSPQNMWPAALPLQSTISERIELAPMAGFPAKVSLVPCVLLYPFGWSTWISLRITGSHTLEQFAALEEYVFTQRCFNSSAGTKPVAVQELLDHISEGIRTDAFCGKATSDKQGKGTAVVVTILAKHGGSLALGALDSQTQSRLKRMVRPEGAPSRRTLDQLTFRLTEDGELNYMVIDDLGRFTWMEKLLTPEGRNHQWLDCYHRNSFMALVQAWQLEGLLSEGKKLKPKSGPLKELLKAARQGLEAPAFTNASLKGFLELSSVKNALK